MVMYADNSCLAFSYSLLFDYLLTISSSRSFVIETVNFIHINGLNKLAVQTLQVKLCGMNKNCPTFSYTRHKGHAALVSGELGVMPLRLVREEI